MLADLKFLLSDPKHINRPHIKKTYTVPHVLIFLAFDLTVHILDWPGLRFNSIKIHCVCLRIVNSKKNYQTWLITTNVSFWTSENKYTRKVKTTTMDQPWTEEGKLACSLQMKLSAHWPEKKDNNSWLCVVLSDIFVRKRKQEIYP